MKRYRLGLPLVCAAAAVYGFSKLVKVLRDHWEGPARTRESFGDFYEDLETVRDPWDIPLDAFQETIGLGPKIGSSSVPPC